MNRSRFVEILFLSLWRIKGLTTVDTYSAAKNTETEQKSVGRNTELARRCKHLPSVPLNPSISKSPPDPLLEPLLIPIIAETSC